MRVWKGKVVFFLGFWGGDELAILRIMERERGILRSLRLGDWIFWVEGGVEGKGGKETGV